MPLTVKFVATFVAPKINKSAEVFYATSMMSNCIFCDICTGKQSAEFVHQDEEVVVFKDIKPAAKFHYLAIPRTHIENVKCLSLEHKPLLEKLIQTGKDVLAQNGGDVNDLRLGFHVPPFNSVKHLHLHVISPVSEAGFASRMIFRPDSWWFATADYIMNNLPPSNKL